MSPVTRSKKSAAPQAVQASAPSAAPKKLHRRILVGMVVSDKMQKTIVVKVDRRVKHSLYGKYIIRSERYKAHDEKNEAKVGDRVELVESRPLSREKRWALKSIIRKAQLQVAELPA